MGLFGLMTGWDQSMAATNAVMANHLISNMDNAGKKHIATQLARRLVEARIERTDEAALGHVSKSCRVTQMNFISNVCLDLNMPPVYGYWTLVNNPFSVGGHTKERDIQAAVHYVEKRAHGVRVNWPGDHVSVNFLEWYQYQSARAA